MVNDSAPLRRGSSCKVLETQAAYLNPYRKCFFCQGEWKHKGGHELVEGVWVGINSNPEVAPGQYTKKVEINTICSSCLENAEQEVKCHSCKSDGVVGRKSLMSANYYCYNCFQKNTLLSHSDLTSDELGMHRPSLFNDPSNNHAFPPNQGAYHEIKHKEQRQSLNESVSSSKQRSSLLASNRQSQGKLAGKRMSASSGSGMAKSFSLPRFSLSQKK
eukprot:Nk52_evm75s485 gene=Nk52_evmTU75s485